MDRLISGTLSLIGAAALAVAGCASPDAPDADVTVVTAHDVEALSAGARLELEVNKAYRFEASAKAIDYSRIDVVDGSAVVPVDALVTDEVRRTARTLELTFGSFERSGATGATGDIRLQYLIYRVCLPMIEVATFSDGAQVFHVVNRCFDRYN